MNPCQLFSFFPGPVFNPCSFCSTIQKFVREPGDEQPNTHDLLGGCQYKSHKQKMELIVQGCCSAVTAAAAAVDL